jgi:hypothetical protein
MLADKHISVVIRVVRATLPEQGHHAVNRGLELDSIVPKTVNLDDRAVDADRRTFKSCTTLGMAQLKNTLEPAMLV